jgi:hypothetical protein
MEEAINNLREQRKDFLKKQQEIKMLELEAVIRFILNNQPYEAFFLHGADNTPIDKRQGRMRLSLVDNMPVLYVNWDECYPFDNQEELFESIFEGDFSSNKEVKITGIKNL